MGFWETAAKIGSKAVDMGGRFMEQAEKNQQRWQEKVERDIKNESYYAKSKSDSELKAQFRNQDNSYAERYAAKQELMNRGYGPKK